MATAVSSGGGSARDCRFSGMGYGVNVDAWRVARVARQLSRRGLRSLALSWLSVQGDRLLFVALARRTRGLKWRNGSLQHRRRPGIRRLRASPGLSRDALLAGIGALAMPVFFSQQRHLERLRLGHCPGLASLFACLSSGPRSRVCCRARGGAGSAAGNDSAAGSYFVWADRENPSAWRIIRLLPNDCG